MEDEEYKKLPIDERCIHKLWKARVNGYEEVTKLFRQIDDEKSPEFSKYLGLVKKFVIDNNAMGQEKGLEATLAYVENYAHAGKTVSEVMSGVVTKCIAAPRARTRELAVQLTLMYIEIEKGDAVQEELIKGMEQKNPKIVAACISACTTALREFGTKIINIKPLVKKIPTLFADRDKAVRDEARLLVIEMYRWMGGALKPQLATLQPVQITELEVEFSKIEGQKGCPTRYIRSQQEKQAKIAAEIEETNGCGDEGEEEEEVPDLDPYDLADPVDILSKMPKDFYEKIEEKKWQERKEALEAVEKLLNTPKLESGDYGDLVRALKKIIQKDSNVVVVALAARCLALLAAGLKKRFQPYSGTCVSALLEKFKEKKQNVLMAVRDAIDAIYLTTTVDAILEDVVEALGNKNPSVKAETALFLARSFTKTLPTALTKKLLKALTTPLTKNINESDPNVRDCAAEALGTMMKLVGEKAIGPFLVELEKDNLKMGKIKEFQDKAVITVKIPGGKKDRPVTAPPKVESKSASQAKVAGSHSKSAPVAKKTGPTSAPSKKTPASLISSGSATVVRSKGGKAAGKPIKAVEKELEDDEVEGIVSELLSASIISDLSSANWKNRLAAVEQLQSELQAKDSKSIPTQAVVKLLARKPGLKDTNFQVLKAKIDVIKYLAENCIFSTTTANCCVNDVSEKFGDAKNGSAVAECMTAIAEATTLGHVSVAVMDFAFGQKSPKVMQEVMVWLTGAIKEFGFGNMNAKVLIENSKKGLASTNPGVRQATINFLGVLYLYMGATLHVFFEGEKPALRDQINAEFDKYEGEKPPPPTRGVVKSQSNNSLDAVEDDDTEPEQLNIQDLVPRVDISAQITEALLNELADKNWKVRNEGLDKVTAILQEAKFIKPNVGDLPQTLAQRLTDSNAKIAQTAVTICETIAKSMGPPCKQHVRTFFPGFLQGLGDSKPRMRSASLDAINAFAEQCGYKEFFEGEMVGDALKSGSPTLRAELWIWLAEKLPKIPVKAIPKEELMVCILHLYSNLEDRNADVRKNANEAVLGIMIHIGYEPMVKQTEKLKPASKATVLAILEKVRPSLPAKPLPKKPSQTEKEDKAVRGTKAVANSKNALKSKGAAISKPTPPGGRKKDEDIDTSPLLVVNNMKNQRTIDESKLKVLKWNFTQPREEFVELLKDQMGNANVNKTLMFNMFHSDFRFHIKAIESLMEDLPSNGPALISNLDLILKWLTLRFFDTNPSVLLKGLEYLHSVFNMLIETDYRMVENEATSFIPYLVLKIGDPKDTVRNGVKSLFKQICNVYPMSKLFTMVMEGLKSKNARQRAECLDVMGSIIEDYGISVCVPSPAACLKEVAKQISDRDNSVRNAALNCVVQAYYIVGEKVYKMVGNISDKDMSLLEERIKRSNRKSMKPKVEAHVTVVNVPNSPQKPTQSPARTVSSNDSVPDEVEENDEEEEEENLPPVTLPPQIIQEPPKEKEITGPYRLDPEYMKALDNVKPALDKAKLLEFDLDFLKEPIKVPSLSDAKADVIPWSPPKPILPNEGVVSRRSLQKINSSPKKQEPVLEKTIEQMGSSNVTLALQSIEQMQEIFQTPKGSMMVDFEDEFFKAIISQLRLLHSQDPRFDDNIAKVYRMLLTVIDAFYLNKVLGRQVSVPVLKDLMNEMITLLVEGKLENFPGGDAYVRVVNLHCVKIIERSYHTNIICALVKLISQCIRQDNSPRQTDLVMKCLWRVIKLMPSWGDEIDYDAVLLEVHNFLKEFPSVWWKTKQVDTPLRTVKTILHSSVKIKGGDIMQHLKRIENPSESEVETYILRLIKSLKIDEAKQVPLKTEPQRRQLSRANHNMLTDIFQKIGTKDETKEGLTLLYDFMQQHPEADVDPFLKKSSKFFQDYIKKGLEEIEISRRHGDTTIVPERVGDRPLETKYAASIEAATSNIENSSCDYWKQRLNMWKKVISDQSKAAAD